MRISDWSSDVCSSDLVITYFNEVPTPTNAVNNQIWDLQSVQALAGPQGTLFGRNSTGGAILFVPRRPSDEWEGSIEVGYGRSEERRVGKECDSTCRSRW